MKMLYFSFVLCLIMFNTSINAQTKPNTIYFELGGNALFTSINFERQILKKRPLNIHIGTGIYGIQPSYLTLPFGINYLFKRKNSNASIDVGFGATFTRADVSLYAIVENRNPALKSSTYWNYIPSVAYRKITKKNMMYRFSISPVINNNIEILPFLGFSIGKNFK